MMEYNYNYDYSGAAPAAAGGIMAAFFGVWFLAMAVFYIYMAICLMKIASKTNTPNGWFAWIPILNMVLMIQVAKKPMWWIILFFIPLVNVILSILIWMAIAEAVKKPSWWGIMVIVPVMNFIMPGYLAFSKTEDSFANTYAPPTPPSPPPVQPVA